MSDGTPPTLHLGLIGDNIARSQAPRLHRLAGELTGLDVTYDRLVPRDIGSSFDEVFEQARARGFRGLNVTYPYKETAAARVRVADPLVRAVGAVNTVIFEPDGPQGFNTDHSGFMKAYRKVRGQTPPGTVCLIGTGGVGKAVAFGLLGLKAEAVRCVDLDRVKVEALRKGLAAAGSRSRIEVWDDPVAAAEGADGIVNCTPVGMDGLEGTPLPASAMTGADWAFDAVYTPVETEFLQAAGAAGLAVISGYELFFAQGLDAWAIFSGAAVDADALRAAMAEDEVKTSIAAISLWGTCPKSSRPSPRPDSTGCADLAARVDRAPDLLDRLKADGILCEGDQQGGLSQLQSRPFAGKMFIEYVERQGGCEGYGAPDAPLRIAAQRRLMRPRGMPRR